jgi:hypothetical protein
MRTLGFATVLALLGGCGVQDPSLGVKDDAITFSRSSTIFNPAPYECIDTVYWWFSNGPTNYVRGTDPWLTRQYPAEGPVGPDDHTAGPNYQPRPFTGWVVPVYPPPGQSGFIAVYGISEDRSHVIWFDLDTTQAEINRLQCLSESKRLRCPKLAMQVGAGGGDKNGGGGGGDSGGGSGPGGNSGGWLTGIQSCVSGEVFDLIPTCKPGDPDDGTGNPLNCKPFIIPIWPR